MNRSMNQTCSVVLLIDSLNRWTSSFWRFAAELFSFSSPALSSLALHVELKLACSEGSTTRWVEKSVWRCLVYASELAAQARAIRGIETRGRTAKGRGKKEREREREREKRIEREGERKGGVQCERAAASAHARRVSKISPARRRRIVFECESKGSCSRFKR